MIKLKPKLKTIKGERSELSVKDAILNSFESVNLLKRDEKIAGALLAEKVSQAKGDAIELKEEEENMIFQVVSSQLPLSLLSDFLKISGLIKFYEK